MQFFIKPAVSFRIPYSVKLFHLQQYLFDFTQTNIVDFFTTDIANDPSSGMQIGEMSVSEADTNKI